METPWIVGVDVGGTFTDLCCWNGREFRRAKVATTPDDLTRGVQVGLAELRLSPGFDVVAGSTVATNTLLERRGARVAFIATDGFADLPALARQNRPRLYDLEVRKPEPLVRPEDCFGVPERMIADGTVLLPLDEAAVCGVLDEVRHRGIESVAVCLLFSYLNPAHEERIGELGHERGLAVSRSSRISPEFREFERASTTLINAYVAPRTSAFLKQLDGAVRRVGGRSVRVMQSNGGQTSARVASREPVRTILSGPAGGAVAAAHVARQLGLSNVLTYDMGGTSTDVALATGDVALTTETIIDGWPVRVPMLDIHTVGRGGGSIASVDAGGVLQVGPQSAGADPGPACYGRGGPATVTDANVALGRIVPAHFLGGRMALDASAAHGAIAGVGERMGCSPEQAALAVIAVADAGMEHALSVVSSQRGFDPGEFRLVSFGGAGGLHACALADGLGLRGVVIPTDAGILSAMGMILADVVKDFSRSLPRTDSGVDLRALQSVFGRLMDEAADAVFRDGFDLDDTIEERRIDLRYVGQAYELTVPVESLTDAARLAAPFHRLHHRRHGTSFPDHPVEAVTARVRATIDTPKFQPPPLRRASGPAAPIAEARVVFRDAEPAPTPVFERADLRPGHVIPGPALVVEPYATTLVPADWRVEVHEAGHLLLERVVDAAAR